MQKSFDAEREVENKLESLEAMVRFQVCYLFDSFLNYFFGYFYADWLKLLIKENYVNELTELTGQEKTTTAGRGQTETTF